LTKSVKTPSAAGLLQMLPRHTKRTENGFVSFSVTETEEAIDARIGEKKRFLKEIANGVVGFLRVKFEVCDEEGTTKKRFGEWRSWGEWQNRKLMTFIVPSKDRVLNFFRFSTDDFQEPKKKASKESYLLLFFSLMYFILYYILFFSFNAFSA